MVLVGQVSRKARRRSTRIERPSPAPLSERHRKTRAFTHLVTDQANKMINRCDVSKWGHATERTGRRHDARWAIVVRQRDVDHRGTAGDTVRVGRSTSRSLNTPFRMWTPLHNWPACLWNVGSNQISRNLQPSSQSARADAFRDHRPGLDVRRAENLQRPGGAPALAQASCLQASPCRHKRAPC